MHISLYVFVVGKEMDRMVTREEKVKRMKGSWEKIIPMMVLAEKEMEDKNN